jgi:hypothetical protein
MYMATLVILLGILELGVRRAIRAQGETTEPLRRTALLKLPLAAPLTQFVYLVAALLATFRRRVTWRGITYYVRKPFDVRVVTDRPFEQSEKSTDNNISI